MSESSLQKLMVEYLNHLPGCMAVSYYNGAVKGRRKNSDRPNGFPDIVGALNGRAFAIEVKVPFGVVSQEQVAMHKIMQLKGWPVRVCHSIDEVQAFIWELRPAS